MKNPRVAGIVRSWRPRGDLIAVVALCLTVIVLAGFDFAHAEFGGAQLFNAREPMRIEAEHLSLHMSDKSVFFTGHVSLTNYGCRVSSDTLRVQYGANFRDVKYAFASGNVRIDNGKSWVSGTNAMLDPATHTILITGSPVLQEHDGRFGETEVKVYCDTIQSDFEGAVATSLPSPMPSSQP